MKVFRVKASLLLVMALCSLNVHARELGSANISVTGNIFPETCTAVEVDNSLLITLQDIPLEKIREIKESNKDIKQNVNKKIEIKCNNGKVVNFSFHMNDNELCTTDSNLPYLCSGPNKSVGMAMQVAWKNGTGAAQEAKPVSGLDNGSTFTLQLDNKIGVLNIGDVYLRTVKGKAPESAPVEANYILKILVP